MRPALRYHGGKWKIAPWIISHFPPHKIYVEPFGGGGSVLLQKPRSYAEIYNDKWNIVVNVFAVLRNPAMAAELERLLRYTPFSRVEFEKCGDDYINHCIDPIEKARLTILRSFAGFGSASTNAKHSTGFRANSNRSGTTPAHDWANYPDNIKLLTDRLQGVVIENRDYKKIITAHDSMDTLIYLDPTYVHSTRNMARGNAAYAYEMSDNDHIDMHSFLVTQKSKICLSGYNSELYNELFSHWYKAEKKYFADGARERVECLWMNYEPNIKTTLFDHIQNEA